MYVVDKMHRSQGAYCFFASNSRSADGAPPLRLWLNDRPGHGGPTPGRGPREKHQHLRDAWVASRERTSRFVDVAWRPGLGHREGRAVGRAGDEADLRWDL